MPFECSDPIQGEFVIGVNGLCGAWHDHGGDGLVAFEEVFHDLVGNCDEMRLEVFGILNEEGGVDDGGEGSVRQISSGLDQLCQSRNEWEKEIRLFSLQRREGGLRLIVLVVFIFYIIVDTRNFLRPSSLVDRHSWTKSIVQVTSVPFAVCRLFLSVIYPLDICPCSNEMSSDIDPPILPDISQWVDLCCH